MQKEVRTRRHPSKACNECKQQKLRCSAQTDYPEPCARCRKLGLPCKVVDGFRRVNKRLRTESLQIENEALRQKLESGQRSPDAASERARSPAHQSFAVPNMPTTPAYTEPDRETFSQYHAPRPTTVQTNASEDPSLQSSSRALPPVSPFTFPRTIGGIRLEAVEIDDIFSIYFNFYAQHLPILDPEKAPNKYYDESPLLFWAIIGVGARRYSGNPTLLGSIADHILHLGWPPLHATPAIVPAIKGLLLLSCFPLPTDSTFKDITYTLSGMAVNLALQIGLHAPLHRQEFSRSKVRYTEDAVGRRVRLWFHCVVVHQKAACGLGYPITVSPDRLKKQMELHRLVHVVPPTLLFEMKLGSLLSRINPLFSPSSNAGDEEHSKFARSLIADAFEAELDELEEEQSRPDLENLHLNVARLQLRVYYLRDCDSLASHTMAKLGISATRVVDLVERLDEQTNLTLYCPHYIFRMTALAGAVLLRMLKAMQFEGHNSDIITGYRSYYFKAISLLRKMSVEDNDGPSRMARIFSRLWTSEKAFKSEGLTPGSSTGSTTFGLLVQSRLSMSILHDTTSWYRDEFGSLSAPAAQGSGDNAGARPSMPQQREEAQGSFVEEIEPSGTSNVPAEGPELNSANAGFDNNAFMFTPGIWDGPFDRSFESMLDAFPETWSF